MSRGPTQTSVITRREFMAASGLAASGAPSLVRQAPSERIGVGFIGLGYRGFQLFHAVMRNPALEVAACGDLWPSRISRIREMGFRRSFFTPMFIKVIMPESVDAVIIAVPDHLQAPILQETLRFGKKAYVETPATHHWGDWAKIDKSIESSRGGLVFWGCQPLSHPGIVQAKQFLDTGKLGEPKSVRVEISGFLGGFSPVPREADLQERNWNWFLGDELPKAEFDPDRFFNWGRYPDFSGGVAMRHIQHGLGAIEPLFDFGPLLRVSSWAPDNPTALPDQIFTKIEFANGPPVLLSASQSLEAPEMRVEVRGTEGAMNYTSRSLRFYEKTPFFGSAFTWQRSMREAFMRTMDLELTEIPLPEELPVEPKEEIELEGSPTGLHLERFFSAVREGKTGLHFEAQRKAELAGHMVQESCRTGSPVEAEGFVATSTPEET